MEKRVDYSSYIKTKISEKEADLRQKKYYQYQIESKVYNLTPLRDSNFLQKVGIDNYGNSIVFLIGYFFPIDKKQIEYAFYYFLNYMDEIKENPYILVYIHTGVSSFEKRQLNYLKDLYKELPIKYFFNLNKLYTVDISWINKWDIEWGFSTTSKFFKKIITYVPSIEDFKNLAFFNKQWEKFIPDFKAHEKSMILKNTTQPVFGRHLHEYALADNGVPYLLIALILYFEENDEHLKIEGIFRKAAGDSDVQKFIYQLENGNYDCIFEIKEPLIVSDLMKKFFKKLQEPLFPEYTYKTLLNYQNIQQKDEISFLKKVLEDVPSLNMKILSFLFKFFKKVISFEEFNKMTAKNISVCFTPCLLRLKEVKKKEFIDIQKEIADSILLSICLQRIIELYDTLFQDDQEVQLDVETIIRRKSQVINEMKKYDESEEGKKLHNP